MQKKILLISYTFLPSPNVGGRRWAKLAAHLVNNSNNVQLITATPDTNGEYNTTNLGNFTVHRIKSGYPEILTHFDKKNLFQKLSYVLCAKFLYYSSKGNIYDKSLKWKNMLQKKIIEISSREEVTNIIVSAPPFQHLYYVAELKSRLPNVNIILDFRDPWAEHHEFDKFYSLSKKRMDYQSQIEEFALKNADYVVSVSKGITDELASILNQGKEKFITITNGIDKEDYDFLSKEQVNASEDFRIIYYGSLYPRTEDTIECLVNFINKNCEQLIRAKVKFEFCGHVNEDSLAILNKADSRILIIHGLKSAKEALTILNQASAGLIIIAKGHEDIQFNTKLLECMALRKKIFLLGPEGSVSHFLTQHNIGVKFMADKMDEMLPWLVNKDKLNRLSYKDFDISPFEYVNLAKCVEGLLK